MRTNNVLITVIDLENYQTYFINSLTTKKPMTYIYMNYLFRSLLYFNEEEHNIKWNT